MTVLDIYQSADRLHFGCDVDLIPNELAGMAVEKFGMFIRAGLPEPGTVLKRVGMVQVVAVEDGATYGVAKLEEEVNKPDINRKPSQAAGTAVIQSLVFDQATFTAEQARAWIAAHDGFVDNGVDETENTYRFRQYDPKWFSTFRTGQLTDGIVAIYGIVKGEAPAPEAAKDVTKTVNDRINRDGLRLVLGSANVAKADEADEAAPEERYILGIVLEPTDGTDGAPLQPDTQGDIYSAADVRKAAHAWMEEHGNVDLAHSWEPTAKDQVRVLESYIAPVDMDINGTKIRKGTWLLALRVLDDEIWQQIKTGGIGAYSIGGKAFREPVSEGTNG